MKTKTLKINKPLLDKLEGEEITLDCDRDGVILDRYWRRRLKDSELDNCVTLVTKTKTKTPGA